MCPNLVPSVHCVSVHPNVVGFVVEAAVIMHSAKLTTGYQSLDSVASGNVLLAVYIASTIKVGESVVPYVGTQ